MEWVNNKIRVINGVAYGCRTAAAVEGVNPLPRRCFARLAGVEEALYAGSVRLFRRAARRRSALDPSAAEAPEEFFAVSSELFFERPLRLRLEYPEVYGQLALFYRQDPAARV